MSPHLDPILRTIRLVVFDFDGVFTDNTVYVSEDGKESVRCWRSDGLGLQMLRDLGLDMLVLSSEENPVVAERCRKLKIPCVSGLVDKGTALAEAARQRGIPLSGTAYVGNDINDRTCLQTAGFPIVVADAYPEVVPLAKFQTHTQGGYGAVREVCELFRAAFAAA